MELQIVVFFIICNLPEDKADNLSNAEENTSQASMDVS